MNDDGASGLHAVIHPDGSAVLTVDETPQEIATTAAEDARREIVERAAAIAQLVGHPVPLVVHEPDGTWPLLVHPDGAVESDEGRARTDTDPVDDPAPATDAPAGDADLPDAAGTGHAEEDLPGAAGAGDVPAPTDDHAEENVDAVAAAAAQWAPAGTAWAPPPAEPESAWAPRATPVVDTAPQTADADADADADAVEATVIVDRGSRSGIPATPAASDETAPTPVAAQLDADAPVSSRHAARHGARPSFLVPERAEEPATQGWRRGLVTLGLRVSPNSAERREREDIAAVSRLWPEPRTVAVVNGKGGSGKTPTAILLAAVFARRGGAGVLAWDNNQTRGTLGWRTEKSEHDATLHDLLPETARLLTSEAQSADLARFVHHQARDRFDVLRSKPIALAEEQRMDSEDVSRIHAVAAKYYRLIIMDSGNDESDPMWLRMIDHTDQLVVATTTRGEHAEAGALLLEALAKRDERTAALAHGAVTIVSQADPAASTDEVRRVVDGFGGLARDVATIPYDPAMIGGALRFDNLRPATQRAWLSAGATIARGLDPA